MTYKSIEFSVDTTTGVARLTLNRPDKMNAFTGDMHAELRDALLIIGREAGVMILFVRQRLCHCHAVGCKHQLLGFHIGMP